MKESFKKNWHIWALAATMIVAFFVRTWELNETLYFKLDQARDAILINDALEEGPGMLPLLGPRAAGTFLRLGPAFYYFQFISASIFGSADPVVLVYPEIIISVLTILVLFVFLRQFFRKETSVILSSLFGLSFMIVQYSRFAWNPNQTPFWSLLFLLGVYKASTVDDKKKAGWWLIGAAAAYGILSQLHFTALIAFPIVAFLFWIFYKPRKIKLVFWAGAISVLILMYIPMILSEVSTNWDNVDQFVYALTHKSEDRSFGEKLQKSLELHGKYYSLFLTSYGNTKDSVFRYIFYAMVAFALWRGFYIWKEGEDRKKKAFLFLVMCWFVVFFLFFTNLSYTVLKPRFWLLTSVIPYIILGLFFEWVYRTGHKKRGRLIFGIVASFLLLANLYAIGFWFWTIKNQKQGQGYVRILELKQSKLVGIKQIRETVDYLVFRSMKTDKQVCYYTETEYKYPYSYLADLYYPEAQMKRMSYTDDSSKDCIFFAVENGGSPEKLNLKREYKEFYQGVSKEQFGVVSVWEVQRDDKAIEGYIFERDRQRKLEKNEQQEQNDELIENEDESEDEDEDEEDEKPERKERVFWKDVL